MQDDQQAAQRPMAQWLLDCLSWTRGFLRYVAGNFIRHQGRQNAASLAYTLLLSLVPLMTVSLAVFSAFPVADRVHEVVQDFLFENFVPASGEVLQQHLQEFSGKASRLTGASFTVLIVVALMMMSTIDRALNTIWEVRGSRSKLHTFLVYWAVLTLGPVLIGASVVVTSYLVSLPFWTDTVGGLGQRLLSVTPVLTSTLGFAMLYTLVPNIRVPWRHALFGGFLAALLFELAKRAFAYYITHFPTYEAIYGALATVPIFLVWVYLSAMIMLLGAEFTRALGMYQHVPGSRGSVPLGLPETVRLLGYLGQAQRQGMALSAKSLGRVDEHWNEQRVEVLLNALRKAQLVHCTDRSLWVLARPLASLSLYDVYRATGFPLPAPGSPFWPANAALGEHLDNADQALRTALSVSLERFLPEEPIPLQVNSRTKRRRA